MIRKAFASLALVAGVLAGCGTPSLRIEPIKKEIAVVTPKFDRGIYRVDLDKNLYFVLKKHSLDPESKKPVDQIVVMRVFWQPIGGTTSMNPASLNATFRYIVMTPDAVGMYEGAGFVRMHDVYGSKTMTAWMVDGDMRLTESTANFHDALGRAGFKGSFSATLDELQTLDQTMSAQRDFFVRSLEISKALPATAPATSTAPATRPDAMP